MAKQPIIVLAAVNSNGDTVAWGVTTKASWEELDRDSSDLFYLLYGGSDLVDTYDSWAGVEQYLAECNGKIAGVYACIAF